MRATAAADGPPARSHRTRLGAQEGHSKATKLCQPDTAIRALHLLICVGAGRVFRTPSSRSAIRKRRSLRSGRAPLPSPGRPSIAGRSELQRFWLGIAQGMTSEDAALTAGMSQPVGTRLFRKAGGMPPATFRSSAQPPTGRYLSFAEREGLALLSFKASRGVRSGAVLVDLPRPSRVSYDVTPRRAAAAWSIVHRQPNGTPSDRPVGPNPPSLHSTQHLVPRGRASPMKRSCAGKLRGRLATKPTISTRSIKRGSPPMKRKRTFVCGLRQPVNRPLSNLRLANSRGLPVRCVGP